MMEHHHRMGMLIWQLASRLTALDAWITGACAPIARPHAPRELPAVFWHAATRGTGTCAYFLFMRSDTYAPRDASQGDPG